MSLSIQRLSTKGWDSNAWLSLLQKIPGVLSTELEPDFTKTYPHRFLWKRIKEIGIHRSSRYRSITLEEMRSWIQDELSPPNLWLRNPFYLSMEEDSDLPWIKIITMPKMEWAFSLFKKIEPFKFFLMTHDFQGGLAFWEEDNLYRAFSIFPKRQFGIGEWSSENNRS